MARKLVAYGVALGFAILGVSATLLLQLTLHRNFDSVLVIAVLLSAWLGGLGPGLVTGVVCAAALNYFFQDPPLQLAVASVSDVVQLATFTLAAVLLSSLTRSRERVRRESAELVQLKTDFVNMVSHELRTPLAATRGAVDLLLEQAADMTPRARRFLQTIRRSTERLSGLVNDLLELARIEAGRVELELVAEDPRRVVRDAIRSIQHQIRARRQHVRVHSDADVPAVLADPRRLEQVLVNLLSNASKYSPRESQLRVDIRAGTNSIDIIVSDTGPGLSVQEQHRVFEKFFRGGDPAGQREQTGTGLGLAIALSLVELQGGRITVHSELQKGASFCVSLPAAV